MARGRSDDLRIGVRNPVIDWVGFRLFWINASETERQAYIWPENLDYVDLSDLDLSDINLSNRSLYGANLSGTNLHNADCSFSDLRSINLHWAQANKGTNFAQAKVDWNSEDELKTQHLIPKPDEIKETKYGLEYSWVLPDGGSKHLVYYENSLQPQIIYYRNSDGYLHKEDGPAWARWHANGQQREIKWLYNGFRQAKGRPARIAYYENGQIACEEYAWEGLDHREDGPAVQEFYTNGLLKSRAYKNWGDLHRLDGPAYESWYKDPWHLAEQSYYKDGSLEPYDPKIPVRRLWDLDGRLMQETYSK